MPMEIAINQKVPFLFHPLYQLFAVVNGGVIFPGRIDPLAVEIDHGKIAAIVSDDDSIDVEHGYNFEDKVFPQYFGHA